MSGDGAGLFEPMFTTDALLAATSSSAWLEALLDAEAALARAEADVGVVPQEAAEAIAAACRSDEFDADELGRAARASGHPVVALLSALRARLPRDAAGWLHWGATSQDILDSALMLVVARTLTIVEEDLARLADGCAVLAERHRSTLVAGRTLLQHAVPTTFGLKAAGWLSASLDARSRVLAVRPRLAVQLGGAAGTLASLGASGPAVVDAFAAHLGLSAPAVPWHTDRTRVAEVAGALGIVAGVAAKIALDVGLLMQTEVAEAAEPTAPGRGGSSAMPQKRNPVAAAGVGAAARRAVALVAVVIGAMPQEHERGLGGWQVEWQTVTELLRAAGGAAAKTADTVAGLEVDTARMGTNLELTGGLVMAERVTLALATSLGRLEAADVVGRAADRARHRGRALADELADEPVVVEALGEDLLGLFDPNGYLGSANVFIDRALDAHRVMGSQHE